MGSTGESVKRLTDSGYDPAWSPDGKQIVFSDGDGQDPYSRVPPAHLWVVPAGGGEVRQLTHDGDAVQPRWSPSGRRIAFWGLKEGGGQRDIWTIPADAQGEPVRVAVTSDPTMDWNPVWSPDGRSLYFASERGGSANLWRVAIDEASGRPRGEPEPVTTPSRRSDSISFSRDGRSLMFVSSDRRSSIQRFGIDPATGHVTEPPRPAFQGSRVIYTQDISPSGEWIAFTPLGGREDLFVVKSDGTGYRQITDDPARDRGPKWSPDGKRIAFYSDRSGRYETYSIRPDGSGLEQLTKTTGPTRSEVTWSPDGKRIATNDGARTWIEDLTRPLDRAPGRAASRHRGRPRDAAAVLVAGRQHARGGPHLLSVSEQRDAALFLRLGQVQRAARGARLAGVAQRQPPAAGRALRSDRAARHPERTRDARPRHGRAGDQRLARRPLGELHRDPRPVRRLDGDARALSLGRAALRQHRPTDPGGGLMRRTIVTTAALGSLAVAQADRRRRDEVERLSWFEGHWQGVSGGVAMEEQWTSVRGGALLGLHRDVKGERMVSFEFLRIQATAEGTFYYASPRSKPPVAFKLKELGERRAVFENLQHDFPQRILYWLDAAGAMHARIEGPQAGKTVSEEWVWTRAR